MGCDCVFDQLSNAADVAIKFPNRAAEGKSIIDNVVVLLVAGLEVSKFGKLKTGAFEGEEVHHPENLLRGHHSVANSLLGYREFVAVKASALYRIHELAKIAFQNHVVGGLAVVGARLTMNNGRSIVETTLGMTAAGAVVDANIGVVDGDGTYSAADLDGTALALIKALLGNMIFQSANAGVIVEGTVNALEVLGISYVVVGKFCVGQFGAFVTKFVHDVPNVVRAEGMIPTGLLRHFEAAALITLLVDPVKYLLEPNLAHRRGAVIVKAGMVALRSSLMAAMEAIH